jgi:hypothetical protein
LLIYAHQIAEYTRKAKAQLLLRYGFLQAMQVKGEGVELIINTNIAALTLITIS